MEEKEGIDALASTYTHTYTHRPQISAPSLFPGRTGYVLLEMERAKEKQEREG